MHIHIYNFHSFQSDKGVKDTGLQIGVIFCEGRHMVAARTGGDPWKGLQ